MSPKKYLETRNKTEFAKKLGITRRALSNYCAGIRLTPLDVALKFAEISGNRVTPKDLLNTWNEKQNDSIRAS